MVTSSRRRHWMSLCGGIAFILIASGGARAESLATLEDARRLTDSVMSKLVANDLVGGLVLLKPYLPISPAEFDATVEKMKLQYPVAQQRFGRTVGSELVLEKQLGTSITKIVQLEKFEKTAMQWTFVFYRATDTWSLSFFNFSDKIADMIGN